MLYPQVFHPSKRRHVDHSFIHLSPLRVAISYGLELSATLFIQALERDLQRILGPDQLLLTLLEALENGQLGVADALLDAGVDPAPPGELPLTIRDRTFIYSDECPRTALDKSIFYGHNDVAALLMRRGAGGPITATTMKFAVAVENLEILSQCLCTAKSSRKRMSRANEILHIAATQGKTKAIKFSLEQEALIESEDNERGFTALASAVFFGQRDAVSVLLDAGADVTAEIVDFSADDESVQSLLQAAATSQQIFNNRLGLVNGFALGSSSGHIYDNSTAQLEKRLTGWLSMNPKPLELLDNAEFMTAIREDSAHGEIISLLLDHGADPTVQTDTGECLLHLAVLSEPRMNALLQHVVSYPGQGLDVNARDQKGRTPLHHAAAACNSAVMELLIEHGADATATDDLAVTTLHFAVFNRKCIEVARKYGGIVQKRHEFLGTPLQFARSLDHTDMHAIDALESYQKERIREGSLQAEPLHVSQAVPDASSKTYVDTENWMMSKMDEYSVLCKTNIKMYLDGSQQQGALDWYAGQGAEAKQRKRQWHLVHDA
ncbi:MAG: hypothetical protein Q9226_008406 [Calogaya cf. arnoldii]